MSDTRRGFMKTASALALGFSFLSPDPTETLSETIERETGDHPKFRVGLFQNDGGLSQEDFYMPETTPIDPPSVAEVAPELDTHPAHVERSSGEITVTTVPTWDVSASDAVVDSWFLADADGDVWLIGDMNQTFWLEHVTTITVKGMGADWE